MTPTPHTPATLPLSGGDYILDEHGLQRADAPTVTPSSESAAALEAEPASRPPAPRAPGQRRTHAD